MSLPLGTQKENTLTTNPTDKLDSEIDNATIISACFYFLLVINVAASTTALFSSTVWLRITKRKRKRKRQANIKRTRDEFAMCHFYLSDREFQRTFCVTSVAFAALVEKLGSQLEHDNDMASRSSGRRIEPALRLALTLRMLSGGPYLDLIMLFRMARSTACDVFNSTVHGILSDLSLPGIPLGDGDKLHELAEGFTTSRPVLNLIWGCVGAIDGIAIKILKPLECFNPRSYVCRKGYFAIPVQAVGDSLYKFLYMFARAVGATHDSLAFAVSNLAHRLNAGELMQGYWIAGDPAYECRNGMITPFSESQL